MSTIASIHTLFPGAIPLDFFDDNNLRFIQKKITAVLSREYTQQIYIDKGSIVRLMTRVVEERSETVPKMNQRVIMYACNDFRTYQLEVDRNLKLEAHFVESQRLYDPTVERGPDLTGIKLSNRLGIPHVGGTTRFYFT